MPAMGMNKFDDILAELTLLRPCIESGYEIVLLSRFLSNMHSTPKGDYIYHTTSPLRDIQILWTQSFRDSLLKFNTSKDELVNVFGSTRDDLIRNDSMQWGSLNTFYPEIKRALTKLQSNERLFIVTTKQERFVRHLLKERPITCEQTPAAPTP